MSVPATILKITVALRKDDSLVAEGDDWNIGCDAYPTNEDWLFREIRKKLSERRAALTEAFVVQPAGDQPRSATTE